MFGEEIILEIDTTLNQLICNAEALHNIDLRSLTETEIEAFQKTQESLVQHLLRMDTALEQKRVALKTPHPQSAANKIREKRQKFERLDIELHRNLEKTSFKMPILLKRRGKKLLVKRK